MKYFPVTVIDDFFDDPIEVKNIAENTEYESPSETNYPGVISKNKITELHPQMADWIQNKVMSLFYHPESDLGWSVDMEFQKISSIRQRISVAIKTRFLQGILYEGFKPNKIMYLSQRAIGDKVISRYKAIGAIKKLSAWIVSRQGWIIFREIHIRAVKGFMSLL